MRASRAWVLSCTVIVALAGCLLATWATSVSNPQVYAAHYENVLGTSFEMKTFAANASSAAKAESAALAEVDREAKLLSSWDATSEFSRWFATEGQPVRVSPELFEVLSLFDEWRMRTDGALDASAEAVTRVWQKAAAEKRMPTQAELDAAAASVRKQHWTLDAANHTATHTSNTPLAMNSFVKSYVIGCAVDAALRTNGVRGVVVDIGGDLVVRGDWSETVDIADPRADAENATPIARLAIRDRAVATSGDYRRGVEIGGQHFSHIVDPRTGVPAEQIISSTAIARVPATAGALATAFSVMTPEESKRLAATVPGVEYMLVERDGKVIESGGWSALELPEDPPIVAQASNPRLQLVSSQGKPAPAWSAGYVLTIGMQLAMFQQFRVRRPYVAVWIDDDQWRPIRTLAVWYDKDRFLHELSEWYGTVLAANQSVGGQMLLSVSSATRPPGAYTFQWDGADAFGKPVKAGRYIVFIEAAREHGTHQLIQQAIQLNGSPQKIALKGGFEISSAYLDYHKTSN